MNSRTIIGCLALALGGCGSGTTGGPANRTVVVYSALDEEFAGPILAGYGKATGVDVVPKFDVESTKSVGLAQLLMQEARRPRCDVFWNNEILNTLRLQEKGLLTPFRPRHAGELPATFRAKDDTWYGFAARGAGSCWSIPTSWPVPTGPEGSATCSTRGGRGRSGSPSPSSGRRRRTRPASSRAGGTRRRRSSSATSRRTASRSSRATSRSPRRSARASSPSA